MSSVRIIFGMSLGAMVLSGCARNLCESDSTNPLCDMIPAPGAQVVSVMPPRLSLSTGGMLAIEVKPAPAAGSSVVLRREGAKDLVLGGVTDGKLTVSLKPEDLAGHGFAPGAAQLALMQPDIPERTAALRLFIDPLFTKPAKVYDTAASSDYPIGIAIGKSGALYTLNQFPPFSGSQDRLLRIGEYQLTGSALAPRVPQTFGAYRAYPFTPGAPGLLALGRTGLVILSRNPVSMSNPILADYCQFMSAQCQSINPMSFDFKTVSALATDRSGGLLTIQTDPLQTDRGTLAYHASETNPFAEKLTVDNGSRPAPKSVVAHASGDLDGDGQADLIAFQAAPTGVSVFLGQPEGRSLRYSEAVSERLQSVLGVSAVTAAAVADVDADGLNDLIVVRDSVIGLFLNQGNGTLAAGPQIPTMPGLDALAVGAMDATPSAWGKLDIAVASSTGQQLAVFLNQAAF